MLPLLLLLAACQPPEQSARDTIAAAKGAIEQQQAKHPECVANPSGSGCQRINRAVDLQNAAIDSLHVYCASSTYESGGSCTPDKTALPAMREAVKRLDAIIRELKGGIR